MKKSIYRGNFKTPQKSSKAQPSHKATVDKQARLLVFCEDVPASFYYAVARKKTFGFE